MDENLLAREFEEDRPRLRAVAYRMLGSFAEADDAVQEAWLRLARSQAETIENLRGWLTTVVGRVCLDMLRTRKTRREDAYDLHLPDLVVSTGDSDDPEAESVLADSVGLALLLVLETLSPAERLAFVLHDMFGVPFDEIAAIVGRSPNATKMLASRARRRVQAPGRVPNRNLARQRTVVDAFLAAARTGDFDALVAVLDPDVVLRADTPVGRVMTLGSTEVAGRALMFATMSDGARPVLVNGDPGLMSWGPDGLPMSVMAFTIVDDLIVALTILAGPDRLSRLDLPSRR